MKKKFLYFLCLFIFLILTGCKSNYTPNLKGFYQSEGNINGYVIQLSFQNEDNSFVEYISNRKVDSGVFEKILTKDNVYILKSDIQNIEILLTTDNSFEIIIKGLNDGNPILLKNISDIPGYFKTEFNDVEEYKKLLGI